MRVEQKSAAQTLTSGIVLGMSPTRLQALCRHIISSRAAIQLADSHIPTERYFDMRWSAPSAFGVILVRIRATEEEHQRALNRIICNGPIRMPDGAHDLQ